MLVLRKILDLAGVTVVIVREDFLNDQPQLSAMLDYRIQAEAGSSLQYTTMFQYLYFKTRFDWVKMRLVA